MEEDLSHLMLTVEDTQGSYSLLQNNKRKKHRQKASLHFVGGTQPSRSLAKKEEISQVGECGVVCGVVRQLCACGGPVDSHNVRDGELRKEYHLAALYD